MIIKKDVTITLTFLGSALILGFIGSLFMIFISPTLLGRLTALSLFVDDLVSFYYMFKGKTRTVSHLLIAGALGGTAVYSYLAFISNPFILVLLIFPALALILRSKGVLGAIAVVALVFLATIPEYLAFLLKAFINYTAFPLTWSAIFILAGLYPTGTTQQTISDKVTFLISPPDVYVNINVNGKTYRAKNKLVITSRSPVNWKVDNVKIGKGVLLIPERREGTAHPSDTVKINLIRVDLNNWDPQYWIGKTLNNYRIIDEIGSGGNSYVMKGELNGRYYAIKIPKASSASSFSEIATEAFNLINLSKDERLVKLYAINADVNVLNAIENGDVEAYLNSPPMIVMEYLEGGTLYDLLKNQSLYNSKYWKYIVYAVIREVAYALNSIHSQGYVHLDVKPQNIFFSRKLTGSAEQIYKVLKSTIGFVKLGDLGSAVRIGGKISQITVEYAPPDQLEFLIRGIGADPRMDIFALGVTMYVALTGRNDRPDINVLNGAVDYYNKGMINEALNAVQLSKSLLASNWMNVYVEPEIFQIMRRMISPNYADRPSLNEVIQVLNKFII